MRAGLELLGEIESFELLISLNDYAMVEYMSYQARACFDTN